MVERGERGAVGGRRRGRGRFVAEGQADSGEIAVLDVSQRLGNAVREIVSRQIQDFQIGEIAHLRRNRAAQPVVGEVQDFEVGEIAHLRRNRAGQPVVSQIQDAQVNEIANLGGQLADQIVVG